MKNPPAPLEPEAILAAEFEYIAQTAFQAHEDRARVSTYYLVSVASLVGAILSTQATDSRMVEAAFAGLFALISAFGVVTLLQLARLRQAWEGSIRAMNHLKEFYARHAPGLPLERAFLWNNQTLPPLDKPWSISFLLAVQVSLLGGVTCGAAIHFAGLAAQYVLWPGAVLGGSLFLAAQLALFRRLLR
jgi:hypothetical protein